MELISEIFTGLWEVWKEMFESLIEVVPTAFSFVLWVLSALIILPSVYISANLFPKWEKWGEKF